MQAFISHAEKDRALAQELIARLSEAGVAVWNPEEAIFPGDNWAKIFGEALEQSDLMIVLLTPGAISTSQSLQDEISFALTSPNYQQRVVTVFLGPTLEMGVDVPWILARLPFEQAESVAQGLDWLLGQVRTAVG